MHRIDEVSFSLRVTQLHWQEPLWSLPSFCLPPMRHKHSDLHGLQKKKEKEMSLILWKVALLSSTLENTIGMHATTPGTLFCANLFPISYQSPKRLRICCPENNVVLPWNMSLMITFGNKLQDMLTTVADSIYPHQMLRLTFWDQFQSHVN